MQFITSLATLAVAVSSVNAMGSAIINNNCDFDVYMWPIDAQRNPQSPMTIQSKGSYSEGYHTPSSGGVSLKLSKSASNGPGSGKITQFEYTVESYAGQNFIWYDGSNVDCTDANCPFYSNGINLKTSVSSCPTRDCLVNQVCTGFYTLWNDDVNSLSCDQSADTIMTLCSIATGEDGTPAVQSPVAAAAVISSPAPTTTSTSKAAVINEAVATTFVTAYTASPHKRAPEPVHHNHMRLHQHAAREQQ